MTDSHYETGRTEFSDKELRAYVGGRWDELGSLQFEFLKSRGLKPDHYLLDVGCGSMRGGVHYINFLEPFHYFGTDINSALVQGGINNELPQGSKTKITENSFLISDNFNFSFGINAFNYGIAFSLFTHLSENKIKLCLQRLRPKFEGGRFFATFFEASSNKYEHPSQQGDSIVTYAYKDPYHYSTEDIYAMALKCGWKFNWIGDFGHPRNQKMAEFIA